MVETSLSVVRDPASLRKVAGKPTVVTIGNFDGVHLGHQDILRRLSAIAKAESAHSVVISFYPHPSVVLGRAQSISRITPLRQKAEQFEQLGISTLFLLHFTKDLAALTAGEFLDRYVLRLLGATHVLLGPDTALGKDRTGDKDFLVAYLGARGVKTTIAPFVEVDGTRVSSRRVRELIVAGEVSAARKLLGRNYQLSGHVRHGAARGRTIGVPTANIILHAQVTPRFGVYASRVTVNGILYDAVTNVGVRPTFGGVLATVESHLFSFSGNLYGKTIGVDLVEWIRPEQRFEGVDALRAQITKDIEAAKEILKIDSEKQSD